MAAIQMLGELDRLKREHGSYKAQIKLNASAPLQPTPQQQREMIVHNFCLKLVSNAVKRESTKFLFDLKMKMQEELRRKQEEQEEGSSVVSAVADLPKNSRTASAPALKRQSSMGSSSSSSSSERKIMTLSNLGRMRSDLGRRRPHTSALALQRGAHTLGRVQDFAQIIKTTTSPEDFRDQLQDQLLHRAKDSKKVFEIICRNMKMGSVCQFNPRRLSQEIDLSHFTASHTLEKVTKLEDLAAFRKKDGMLLFLDPSTNTYGHKVVLRISFLKAIDIGEDQEMKKDYTFWSDGNYYGLQILQEARSTVGLHSLLMQDEEEETGEKSSLPGWNGRPPIYIPAPICQLQVLDTWDYAQAASLAYNLSHLKLFAISCPNPKAGMKRLQEFLDQQLLIEMASFTVTGGISALHLSALHGNEEAVQTLVSTGANINHRCKGDKYLTPLHEAVIGGHVNIVRYLLSQGASQVVTDEVGRCPLHYSCQLGHVTISRLLMESPGGRRALLLEDRFSSKPIDMCATNFLKSQVEAVMRKHKIYKKPRVSIMDRI